MMYVAELRRRIGPYSRQKAAGFIASIGLGFLVYFVPFSAKAFDSEISTDDSVVAVETSSEARTKTVHIRAPIVLTQKASADIRVDQKTAGLLVVPGGSVQAVVNAQATPPLVIQE